jgi:type VI secretion system secreted protein VgrG
MIETDSSELSLEKSKCYTLQIENSDLFLPILSINGEQQLNQLWRYEIIVTSNHRQLQVETILAQKAILTFQPPSSPSPLKKFSSSTMSSLPRTLYGIITEFSQIAVNKQQVSYKVVLEPRLALLKLHQYNAMYQNQSVIEVVEQILHKHQFTGIDYRLELKQAYPMHDFIIQWQENDLVFIQRILADINVWFRFETDNKHKFEVLIISDSEQRLTNNSTIA